MELDHESEERCSEACPRCGSAEVIPIVYGLPGPGLVRDCEAGEVELGGCCVYDNMPTCRCRACGFGWAAPPTEHEQDGQR